MGANNYFKVRGPKVEPPARRHPEYKTELQFVAAMAQRTARIVAMPPLPVRGEYVFFDGWDAEAVREAWIRALEIASGSADAISVLRTPYQRGPWRDAHVVGDEQAEEAKAA